MGVDQTALMVECLAFYGVNPLYSVYVIQEVLLMIVQVEFTIANVLS